MNDAEKLARAVILFHRGGDWSAADRESWRKLTGADEATTVTLCDCAREVLDREVTKRTRVGKFWRASSIDEVA